MTLRPEWRKTNRNPRKRTSVEAVAWRETPPMSGASDSHISRKRDAVRILHILNACGAPIRKPPSDVPDAVTVVKAEKRLQALDFWVRNPDYLAKELLDQYADSMDPTLLDTAEKVMAGNEPELRRLGMLRFYFGAFESVQDAVANLKMLGLVEVTRTVSGSPPRLRQRDYYLRKSGREKADELAQDPILRWYAERAALVAKVAGNRSGAGLKKVQYNVAQYLNARWGEIIAPITDDVRAEIARLRAGAK